MSEDFHDDVDGSTPLENNVQLGLLLTIGAAIGGWFTWAWATRKRRPPVLIAESDPPQVAAPTGSVEDLGLPPNLPPRPLR
jgi:hypothetical protein